MKQENTILVTEVGPRDGLQNQPQLVSTAGKLKLIAQLVAAGVKRIEATSFVSPKAVPQMSDARELFARLPENPDLTYTALIPNEKGYQLALEAGVKSVGIVLGATEMMNQKNIHMSLEKARTVFNSLMRRAKEDKIEGRAYIAVAFECPYEGRIKPDFVKQLTTELFESGATEVIIADTIGAASPTQVYDLFSLLAKHFDVDRLSAHFHDTRAMALANVWAALQVGIRKFDSSIGGMGGCPFAPGTSGNLATEDLVLMLHQCGFSTGIDIDKLRQAIAIAEGLVNTPLGGRMMPWLVTQEKRDAQNAARNATRNTAKKAGRNAAEKI